MAILGQIRKRSFFLILVIGMALFAFVISGVFTSNGGFGSNKPIGEINGEEIDFEMFNSMVEQAQVVNGLNTIQAVNFAWEQGLQYQILTQELEKLGIDAGKNQLEQIISQVKNNKINGVNVTVPYKKAIIPYLDELSEEAQSTQSVNTIYQKKNKVIGHNTDIGGFEFAIKDTKYDLSGKKVLILGAGGVVPSLIFALKKMKVFDEHKCMLDSYYVLTNKVGYESLLEKGENVALIFNPTKPVVSMDQDVYDVLIEYFESVEDYEKCQDLLNCKKLNKTFKRSELV